MSISVIIPSQQMTEANEALAEAGLGPENFTVPMATTHAPGIGATHAGLHCWDDPGFLEAIEELGILGAVISRDNFEAAAQQQALAWKDAAHWTVTPIMTGDQYTFGGKLWESLIDYNVWAPPVGWREVVATGYPAWVQPTGAHDAYGLGDRVTHNEATWESSYAANVWEPGVFGWTQL